MLKLGSENWIHIPKQVTGSSTRSITCCFPDCVLGGIWNTEPNWDFNLHSHMGVGVPAAILNLGSLSVLKCNVR